MKDNPKKLRFEGGPEFQGIIPDPVDADINLPLDWLPGFGKREGDNIGIEVVMKEFTIDFQEPAIGDKNILKLSQSLSLFLKQGDEGCPDSPAVPQTNSLFKMKPDSRRDCHNFTAPR